MGKVVIFGIDGGSLPLIEQWIEELPTFKKIVTEGTYGSMQSTVPALTCPAWPSMFTGKNPGNLGIYDFLHLDSGKPQVVSSSDYHSSSLWKIASEHGKTVGLLNVPMTYPPHEINGYMVCGLGTPETTCPTYTYPAELQFELDKLVLRYDITPNVLITLYNQEDNCIKSCSEILDKRLKVAKYLIRGRPTDLFVCIFFVSDVIQHYFWRYMDESHPRYEESNYKDVIKSFYIKIDKAIGELMDEFEDDTRFMIVSDHGFGACYGGLSINRWLESVCLLKYKKNSSSRLYQLRDLLLARLSPELLRFFVRIAPKKLIDRLTTTGEAKNLFASLYDNLKWDETKAFVLGTSGGGIFVNLKGRQPFGSVDKIDYEKVRTELVDKLAVIGMKAFRKEEVYHGKYIDSAPDIAIELGSSPYYPITLDKGNVWLEYAASGAHKPEAMFFAYGNGIGHKKIKAQITDVAPTSLKLMGLNIPEDIDGEALL